VPRDECSLIHDDRIAEYQRYEEERYYGRYGRFGEPSNARIQ
jgi:hypothetical protein